MFYRTVYPALVAGLLAGLLLFALQSWITLPLIHVAEGYENASEQVHASNKGNPPDSQVLRKIYTASGDVLVAIGFGLLLTGIYALTGRYGLLAGILWGLAGFVTFHLAPAAIVPPSLPALKLAPLSLRQGAWLVTACSTAAGLSFLAFGKGATRLLGLVCLSVPAILFFWIAPLPHFEIASPALSSIERRFTLGVLGTSLLFWIFLGASSGHLFGTSRRADSRSS